MAVRNHRRLDDQTCSVDHECKHSTGTPGTKARNTVGRSRRLLDPAWRPASGYMSMGMDWALLAERIAHSVHVVCLMQNDVICEHVHLGGYTMGENWVNNAAKSVRSVPYRCWDHSRHADVLSSKHIH